MPPTSSVSRLRDTPEIRNCTKTTELKQRRKRKESLIVNKTSARRPSVIRVKVLQVTNESSDREFKPIRNLSIETRRIKRPHSSQETLEGVSHDVKRDSRYTVCFFVGIVGREDRVVIEGEAEECVEEAKGGSRRRVLGK